MPGYLIELMHQLTNSGAKAVFASLATFPLVRSCALKAGIRLENIFLFEPHSVAGYTTYGDLLQYGEYNWTPITALDQLSKT